MSSLRCSVVIPSHQRRETLELVLRGLAEQTAPPSSFDVVVVLDGSRDGSEQMLRGWVDRAPFALRWFQQEQAGPSAARNRGVQETTAAIILFLDDDVVPEPDLVERHLAHHARDDRIAVLGDYPIVRARRRSLAETVVWAWWDDLHARRERADHDTTYMDFCSGNVSLRREDLVKTGGFDPEFRRPGREDYEFGYRLLRAGVRFVVARDARAKHHYRPTVRRILGATRNEGRNDVLLGELHPELRSGLTLMWPPDLRRYRAASLALHRPMTGAMLAAVLRRILVVHTLLRRRNRWLRIFGFLRAHAYWRGVMDALGSREALETYRAGALAPAHLEIDITDGLPDPLGPGWVDGPCRITVTAFGRTIGEVVVERALEEPVRARLADLIAQGLRLSLMAVLAGDARKRHDLAGRAGLEHPASGVGA